MPKLKVYLAGPLFTLAERSFNRHLAKALLVCDPNLEVVLPQDFAALISPGADFWIDMYRRCLDAINQSDVLLAVLEGADADSGTCVEVGYAVALGKPIIGVRTDLRAHEYRGLNLMVVHSCKELIFLDGTTATIEGLAVRIVPALLGAVTERENKRS